MKINNIKESIKEKKGQNKTYEQKIMALKKINSDIEFINIKEENQKNKLYKKALKASKNDKLSEETRNEIINKFVSFNLDAERNKIVETKNTFIDQNAKIFTDAQKINSRNEVKIIKEVQRIEKKSKIEMSQYIPSFKKGIYYIENGYNFQFTED
ncbi:hypothetical protein [Mesoplasma melaleucae]|uniref:Uncharacterized protein n=1 Tax=Mesoplasma melaleucae TaxID=81459 RepID=A0A2K8P005_9MOLU|nr:hypothetical protein [Mesoplasma melaleucae]ATZ18223.1 hypothetical protein EMELA_v1c07280 [Mesoplasma melaleucae]